MTSTEEVQRMSKDKRLSPSDPNSHALPEEAKVNHMDLKWTVDFENQRIKGSIILSVQKVDPSASVLTLDARHLDIQQVKDDKTGQELEFSLSEENKGTPFHGSKLQVQLPSTENESKIKVAYSTTEGCTAFDWLTPEQTAGKSQPYMFSQCQAIHARTMMPCQDTPAVKSTYSATVSAPSNLNVVMSAVKSEDDPMPDPEIPGNNLHVFAQRIPIQSYLVAIASGDLVSRKIGPRSRVWAEKEIVDKAAKEFEDTEAFLSTAEELCGKYVWGVFDLLVLPPSFPYGGMENPCLTFVTPTLLAGDKSLVDVIAHEIAHSWAGNLVTNKNFEHFWLNEGFTVFLEQKIIGRLHGEPARHFSAVNGLTELKEVVNDVFGPESPLTALVVDLEGVNPADSFSIVPYDKGATFLWYLEELVGGPKVFEPFIKSYLEHFKFQSIDTSEFKAFFLEFFRQPKGTEIFKDLDLTSIDWETWLYKPGMPPQVPNFDRSLAVPCEKLMERWVKWDEVDEECPFTSTDLKEFTTGQTIEFFALLLQGEPLSIVKLERMQQLYQMNNVENSEIKFKWIRLGLQGHFEPAVPKAIEMMTEQARMKFLRPLYRDLYQWESHRQGAIEVFHLLKQSYMPVAVYSLEKDLQLS